MKVLDVVKAFVDGKDACTTRSGSTTHERQPSADGFGSDRKLFSYDTCIAEYRGGKFYVNITKYSSTTTKLQQMVTGYLEREEYDYDEIINVRINTYSIVDELEEGGVDLCGL